MIAASAIHEDTMGMATEFSSEELRQRNRALSLLLDLSSGLAAEGQLDQTLEQALARILAHFHLDSGRIYLLCPERRALILHASSGIDIAGLEQVQLSEGFSGLAARRKTLLIRSVYALPDPGRKTLLLSKGVHTVICVPLILQDRVVGVMNLTSSAHFAPSASDVDLLLIIGNQIAVAVDHARLYQKYLDHIAEIERKKETIKRFAYSISHDLKSPAIGVHGLSRLMKRNYMHQLDEDGRHYCDQIVHGAEQIALLVKQLNEYIHAREISLKLEEIDLQQLWNELEDEYRHILQEKHVRWTTSPSPPVMVADRVRVARALRNLIDNALKYGGGNLHQIRVCHEAGPRHHVLSVSDDGKGVCGQSAEKLFAFFKRQISALDTDGVGMGLAIVREIARRHGGDAWARSRPEGGVTFYFSIDFGLQPTPVKPEQSEDGCAENGV